jgi:hypothetical protein
MNNVIRLFAQKNVEIVLPEQDTRIAPALTNVLASSEQLGHKVKELTEQFDAFENAIDTIEDTETRTRLRESIKQSRETLLKAMLQLTQQIGKWVAALH